jgi:hypothetical protein
LVLLLGCVTILDPIDQITWLIQARMVDKEPSGEIVFVGLDPGIASSTSPQARRNLAEVLDKFAGRSLSWSCLTWCSRGRPCFR